MTNTINNLSKKECKKIAQAVYFNHYGVKPKLSEIEKLSFVIESGEIMVYFTLGWYKYRCKIELNISHGLIKIEGSTEPQKIQDVKIVHS